MSEFDDVLNRIGNEINEIKKRIRSSRSRAEHFGNREAQERSKTGEQDRTEVQREEVKKLQDRSRTV